MGWRYSYFLFLDKIDLAKATENARKLGLSDFTEVAKKAEKYEVEHNLKFLALLKKEGVTSQEIVDNVGERSKDEEVQKFIDASNPFSNELGFYSLSFYQFRDCVVMYYVSATWDIRGDWLRLALGLLHGLGYRGKLFFVSGNSVTDSVSIAKILVGERCKVLSRIHGPEGQYLETLKSVKNAPLLDMHSRFDNERVLLLVLGKYLSAEGNK